MQAGPRHSPTCHTQRDMSDPKLPISTGASLSSKFEVEPEIASLSTTLAYSRQPTSGFHCPSTSPGGSHHPERKAWYKAEHRKQIWERATPTKVARPICVVVRYGSVVWHAKVSDETYVYYLKRAIAYRFAPQLGPNGLQYVWWARWEADGRRIIYGGRRLKDCQQIRDTGIEHGDEVECSVDYGG